MGVAEVNDGFRVGELEFEKSVLDLNWVVAIFLVLDDLFNGTQLADLGGGFDVLFVDLFVIGAVDNSAQEEKDTLERTH